ncbi:MAG: hypothetical protein M3Q66_11515, partial [Chloroflexota bacterium]|nr:hypothetical protein [Chloroflexota bacterium]
MTLQEVTIMTPDGDVHDQPAELARLTGWAVRYAATHSFQLVEPETGRAIGMASWGNAILGREPLAAGFAVGLPRAADDDLVEVAGARHHVLDQPHPLIDTRYRDTEPGHREPRCIVGGTLAASSTAAAAATIATTHLT